MITPQNCLLVLVYNEKQILAEHGFKTTEKSLADFNMPYVGTYQFFVTYSANGKNTRISNVVTFVLGDAYDIALD